MQLNYLPLDIDTRISPDLWVYDYPTTCIRDNRPARSDMSHYSYTYNDVMRFVRELHHHVYNNIFEACYNVNAYDSCFIVNVEMYFMSNNRGETMYSLIDDHYITPVEIRSSPNHERINIKSFVFNNVLFHVSPDEPNIAIAAAYIVYLYPCMNNEQVRRIQLFAYQMCDEHYVYKYENRYEIIHTDTFAATYRFRVCWINEWNNDGWFNIFVINVVTNVVTNGLDVEVSLEFEILFFNPLFLYT